MWVSLPVSDQERQWIEELGGPWRLSADSLWRSSGVEVALVTHEIWQRWKLPQPSAPIISLDVPDDRAAIRIIDLHAGVSWAMPYGLKPWGVVAGLLRFPSGLLIEIIEATTN